MASFNNESFDIPAGYAVEKIDGQLYIEDIAEDDEIYIIRTPIDIELSELDKKKIILPINSGDVYMKNIKIKDGRVLECLAETREIPGTCVVLPRKSDGQLHVLNKPLKGSILICESLEEHNDVDIKTEVLEEPPESAAVNVKVKSEEQTKVKELKNSVKSSQQTKKKKNKKKKHFPPEFEPSHLNYETEDAEYLLPDMIKEQFPKKDTKSSDNIAVNSQTEDCVKNSHNSSLKTKKKSKKEKRHSFSGFDVSSEKDDILVPDSLELDNDVVIKTEILEELQESLENSTEETKIDKTKIQSAAMNVKVKLEDKTEVKQLINPGDSSQKTKKKKNKNQFPCEIATSDLNYETGEAEHLFPPTITEEQSPKKCSKSSYSTAVNSQNADCVKNSLKTKKKKLVSDFDVSTNNEMILECVDLSNDVDIKTEVLEELQECLEKTTEEMERDKTKSLSAAGNVNLKSEDKMEVELINPESSSQVPKMKKNKKKKHILCEFEPGDLNYETKEAVHLLPPDVIKEESPKKNSKSNYNIVVNSQCEDCVENSLNSSLKTKKKRKRHSFDVSSEKNDILTLTLDSLKLDNDVVIKTEVLEELQDSFENKMKGDQTESPFAAVNVKVKSGDKPEVEQLINQESSSEVPKKKKNKKKKQYPLEFEPSDLNYETEDTEHLIPADVIKEQFSKKNSLLSNNIEVNSQSPSVDVTVKSEEKMEVEQLINPESSSQEPKHKKHFPLKFETGGLNYETKDVEHFFSPDVIKKLSDKKHLKSRDNIAMNFPNEDCIENFPNCSVKNTDSVSGIDVNTNNNKTANPNNSVDPMKFTRLFEETLKKTLG